MAEQLLARYRALPTPERRRIIHHASEDLRAQLAHIERTMAMDRSPGALAAVLTEGREKQARHLDMIDDVFRRIAAGERMQVMITCPPRHGKSQRASRWGPLWYLRRNPTARVMLASYGADLADDHGRWVRDQLRSYGTTIGVRLDPGSHAANRFDLEAPRGSSIRGGMVTAGVGGSLTGKGFNLGIIDDPFKGSDDANSPAQRERIWNWYQSVFYTRRAPGASIILINTRWHCLLPGTDIVTPMGLTPIEAITSKSSVITSQGEQEVVATASKRHKGEIISLITYGYPKPLKLTPEHRVLTTEGWREAGELRPTDWLVFPIPKGETSLEELRRLLPEPPKSTASAKDYLTGERLPVTREQLKKHLDDGLSYQAISELYGRKTRASAYSWANHYGLTRSSHNAITGDPISDPDFWRIVGYWVAEGDATSGRTGAEKNVVRWTFGHSEQHLAQDVTDVLAKYGLRANHRFLKNGRSISVRCSSQQLARFLAQFGSTAHTKRLPEAIVHLPEHFAQEFLRGYWTGDGCTSKGWARIASVSLDLLMGVYRMLARLGITSSIMAGRKSVSTLYEIRFPMHAAPFLTPGTTHQNVRAPYSVRIEDGNVLVRIKSIGVEDYDGPVYDIQTPSHDFVANNFIVHNCDDLAGRILATEPENWTLIDLPALALSDNDPLGRQPGQALWPEQYDEEELARTRRAVGERVWWALYQQQPRPLEGGVWQWSWITDHRISPVAFRGVDLARVVVALDPAGGDTPGHDESGIVAAGRSTDGHYYVLADKTGKHSAEARGRETCLLALELQADAIVVETNYGGDMARQNVVQAWAELERQGKTRGLPMPRVVDVTAKKGKRLRAEPIAQLYETGLVHHCAEFPDLERQMVTWLPGMDSPDRMDAAVHALTELADPSQSGLGVGQYTDQRLRGRR
ncbi:LAGLIDADG family homing endonuclease [Streptomyces griseoincarnatus]